MRREPVALLHLGEEPLSPNGLKGDSRRSLLWAIIGGVVLIAAAGIWCLLASEPELYADILITECDTTGDEIFEVAFRIVDGSPGVVVSEWRGHDSAAGLVSTVPWYDSRGAIARLLRYPPPEPGFESRGGLIDAGMSNIVFLVATGKVYRILPEEPLLLLEYQCSPRRESNWLEASTTAPQMGGPSDEVPIPVVLDFQDPTNRNW